MIWNTPKIQLIVRSKNSSDLQVSCYSIINKNSVKCLGVYITLTLSNMSHFGAGHVWGKEKLKIRNTYPKMIKLGAVLPWLRNIQKDINHIRHLLTSADISVFP